jgi:hypothetical protein
MAPGEETSRSLSRILLSYVWRYLGQGQVLSCLSRGHCLLLANNLPSMRAAWRWQPLGGG